MSKLQWYKAYAKGISISGPCVFDAPNFEKVEGAYCFGPVRQCACSKKSGFLNFIMGFLIKLTDPYFLIVRIISLCGVMPLLKGQNEIL